jgi:hypothetical protein
MQVILVDPLPLLVLAVGLTERCLYVLD